MISGRGEGRVQIAEVVLAGEDDDAGVRDVGGPQDLREPVVADDEAGAVLREPLLGVGGRADDHDLLVAEAQFLVTVRSSRWSTPADDGMALGRLGTGRRHGRQSTRPRGPGSADEVVPGLRGDSPEDGGSL